MLLLMLSIAEGEAAVRKYRSQRLADIAGQLQAEYQIDCSSAKTCPIGNYTLSVVENSMREVCHIGFQLFLPVLTKQNPSPVYRFVERYLLELFLLKDSPAIRQKLQEDKVNLRFGNGKQPADIYSGLTNMLSAIKENFTLSITTDNSHYTVSWLEGKQPFCSLRFPIQYELMWGINKKETEAYFYTDLLHYLQAHRQKQEALPLPPDKLPSVGGNCYVWEGEWYAIEAMNTNRYYKRRSSDGKYEPLCSLSRPEESVQNLFTLDCSQQITASVTQRLYGRKKNSFEVPLHVLLNFCRQEGCEVFAGIENCNGKEVSGTLTLLNRSLGYNHLMFFKTDYRVLEHPERYPIEIQLYAYVPTHNLHSLFSEPSNTNKKEKK